MSRSVGAALRLARRYDAGMSRLVDLGYACGALAYLPVLLFQAVVQKKHRGAWAERFGRVDARASTQPRVWIHAVSVGEVNATRQLVAALLGSEPAVEVVISTTTDTGYARARQLYPDLWVFRYPLDFSAVVRRVLTRVRPTMIVLMELEVWYNLLALAAQAGVPVVVVNGRLTERSARRFGLIGPIARRMFSRLAWVCAQDEVFAARFRDVGVPAERIQITGSLKWDTATVTDSVAGADVLAAAVGIDTARPLIVAGSTGPGEEAMVLDAYARVRQRHPDAQLAIVPRKPERFDEVAALIEQRGFVCIRRSASPDGTERPRGLGNKLVVVLGDTMGELRKFYILAAAVFVGRTLIPLGGSDMMEVAGLGKPVVVGPHTENFREAARKLREGGGMVTVADTDGLGAALDELLSDAARRTRVGAAARQVVRDNQGSTQRTVTRLLEILAQRRAAERAAVTT